MITNTSSGIPNLEVFASASSDESVSSICGLFRNGTDDINCRLHALANCTAPDCVPSLIVLIFPLLALFLGCLLKPITRLVRIPYTLVLLMFGMAIGTLGCAVDMGRLTISLQQWVHLSPPDIFFYVFLAPLIFEAAFNTDWHIFRRLLVPILTAAFPIVIIQAGLIAGFTKLVTTEWSWWPALMFGAMLSATDPISVVATLKEVGASEYLGTLIEGESLVNDGSAFVLWEVFFHNAVSEQVDPEDSFTITKIITKVLISTVGGVSLGIAFAVIALIILAFVYDELEVETSLTVVVAFLGFWTAQSPAHLSGVIANVAAGLTLSAYGKPLISQSVRHPLAEFWELLGWIANTIVFVHAGVLTVAFVWPCPSHSRTPKDYLLVLGLYLFLQVIRVGLFGMSYPVLSWGNKWLTWKEALVVGFSGLRGSVSLILALNVAAAKAIDESIRYRVQMWTTAVVFLSLFVNGLFIPVLLSKLGLDRPGKVREKFIRQSRALIIVETLSTLDKLCVDVGYRAAKWSYVLENVLPKEWLKDPETHINYALAFEDRNNLQGKRVSEVYYEDYRRKTLSEGLFLGEIAFDRKRTEESIHLSRHHSLIGVGASANFGERMSRYSLQRIRSEIEQQPLSDKPSFSTPENYTNEVFLDESDDGIVDIQEKEGEDSEVRRRVLISLLSHVRAISSSTLTEYSALKSFEDDVQNAIDANEEDRAYDIFGKLNTHNFIAKLFSDEAIAEDIVVSSVIFFALSETLKQNLMHKSMKVKNEVEQMFNIAAFKLNRLERKRPYIFKWIHSQFAIYKTIAKQDSILKELQNQGLIDSFEFDMIHSALVTVRRKHSIQSTYIRKNKEWRSKGKENQMKKLKQHPIFSDIMYTKFEQLSEKHIRVYNECDHISVGKNALLVVLDGGIKYTDSPENCFRITNTSVNEEGSSKWRLWGKRRNDKLRDIDFVGNDGCTSHHWCFTESSSICSPKLVCAVNNEAKAPECVDKRSSMKPYTLEASQLSKTTTVFGIGEIAVHHMSRKSKSFRDEITRSLAHNLVLESISEEETYSILQLSEALSNSLNEYSNVGRAYKLLERLPYMTVQGLRTPETLQGPGLLINGCVKVSVNDVNGLPGADTVVHTCLKGPALLPSGLLTIEEASSENDEFANDGEGVSKTSGEQSTFPIYGTGYIFAHVLLEFKDKSLSNFASERLNRWKGSKTTIDMNGRFKMFRHVSFHPTNGEEKDDGNC